MEYDERRQSVLLGHLLAQILEHGEKFGVGHPFAAPAGGCSCILALFPVVIVVEGDIDIVRLFEVLLTRIVHRQQTIILDILVHQTEDEHLPYHSPPEAVVVIGPGPEPFALVVSVRLYHGGRPAYEDVHEIIHLELGAYRLERLQHHQRLFACLHLGPRIHAIVAASAVILSVLLAEVVQQRLAAAHGTFGIRHGLHQ